jgi:dipeptide transport system substrate-binding protein
VKWQSNEKFTPTRDFNADDVIFSFERQWKADNPWHQYIPGISYDYFHLDGHAGSDQVDREGRRLYRQVHADRAQAPMIANLAMDFASIVSKEYADQLEAAGTWRT